MTTTTINRTAATATPAKRAGESLVEWPWSWSGWGHECDCAYEVSCDRAPSHVTNHVTNDITTLVITSHVTNELLQMFLIKLCLFLRSLLAHKCAHPSPASLPPCTGSQQTRWRQWSSSFCCLSHMDQSLKGYICSYNQGTSIALNNINACMVSVGLWK